MEHVADRPSWDCLLCEQPWPCDPAREELAQLSPTRLAVLMWGHFEAASMELPGARLSVEEMFDRFLGWTAARPRR